MQSNVQNRKEAETETTKQDALLTKQRNTKQARNTAETRNKGNNKKQKQAETKSRNKTFYSTPSKSMSSVTNP